MDELRVIDSGLTGQDRVFAGVLRAVPGQKVDPQMQAACGLCDRRAAAMT